MELTSHFFLHFRMSTQEKYTLKIVILGNSGVGKTSIVNRWITGVHNKAITPTVGANHQKKTIEIDHKNVDLFIWDTAGQEQFQALTPLYTRSAACAIICTSIIDAESFTALDTWKNLVLDSCDKPPPMILCVNKIDLANDKTMSNEEIEEKYSSAFSTIFFVSAFTGEGINEVFTQSGKLGLEYSESVQQQPPQVQDLTKKKEKKGCC